MHVVISPLPLFVFMAWCLCTGTTLHIRSFTTFSTEMSEGVHIIIFINNTITYTTASLTLCRDHSIELWLFFT